MSNFQFNYLPENVDNIQNGRQIQAQQMLHQPPNNYATLINELIQNLIYIVQVFNSFLHNYNFEIHQRIRRDHPVLISILQKLLYYESNYYTDELQHLLKQNASLEQDLQQQNVEIQQLRLQLRLADAGHHAQMHLNQAPIDPSQFLQLQIGERIAQDQLAEAFRYDENVEMDLLPNDRNNLQIQAVQIQIDQQNMQNQQNYQAHIDQQNVQIQQSSDEEYDELDEQIQQSSDEEYDELDEQIHSSSDEESDELHDHNQQNQVENDELDLQIQQMKQRGIPDLYDNIQKVIDMGIVDENVLIQQNRYVNVKRQAQINIIVKLIDYLSPQLQQGNARGNNVWQEQKQKIIFTLITYLRMQENDVLITRNFNLSQQMLQFINRVKVQLRNELRTNLLIILDEELSMINQLGYMGFFLQVTSSFASKQVKVDWLYEGRFAQQHFEFQLLREFRENLNVVRLEKKVDKPKNENEEQQKAGRPKTEIEVMQLVTWQKEIIVKREIEYLERFLTNQDCMGSLEPLEKQKRKDITRIMIRKLKSVVSSQKDRFKKKGGILTAQRPAGEQFLQPDVIVTFMTICEDLSELGFRYDTDICVRCDSFLEHFENAAQDQIRQQHKNDIRNYIQK